MKIKKLEDLAREMVGDGKSPHLYFVSIEHKGVVLVSRDFEPAYEYWKSLPRNIETMLEDRHVGVICSTEPQAEGSTRLVTYDDSRMVHA